MDILTHNRAAWDKEVEGGNPWTLPVSSQVIDAARRGEWSIVLTEGKAVPRDWFPVLQDCEVLCLASGGGQQAPVLAAAGAKVTVFDNSPRQLAQDRFVAERDGLSLRTIEGDMADLSVFADDAFDLIFHPTSNLFVPDVLPVWKECYRVLRRGGVLLAGFLNPVEYVFDRILQEQGVFQVKYPLPYSDLTHLTEDERAQAFGRDAPVEWSHTLTDQIGGQLAAGFHLTALYEDYRKDQPIKDYMPSYLATRAVKP